MIYSNELIPTQAFRHSSRSALVAEAMEAFLKKHTADEITRKYNEYYDGNAEELEVAGQMRSTMRRLTKGQW